MVCTARGNGLSLGDNGRMLGFLGLRGKEDAIPLARKMSWFMTHLLEESWLSSECKEKVLARGAVLAFAFP